MLPNSGKSDFSKNDLSGTNLPLQTIIPFFFFFRTCHGSPIKIKASILENQPVGTPIQMLDAQEKFKLKESYEIHHPAFVIERLGNKVQIRSRQVFDREKVPSYHIKIFDSNTKNNVAILDISVTDVNDNLPVFNLTSTRLIWNIKPIEAIKYAILGKISAYDPDLNEQVVYGLDRPDPCCIIVPQTGEVMLVDPEAFPTQLTILAKEKNFPSRQSKITALLDIIDEDQILEDNNSLEPHLR